MLCAYFNITVATMSCFFLISPACYETEVASMTDHMNSMVFELQRVLIMWFSQV